MSSLELLQLSGPQQIMTNMPTNEQERFGSDSESIGAVVIGRNEGKRLRSCIESLNSFVAAIIYVDSASVDGSALLARSLGVQVVELTTDLPLTAARGRAAGLEALLRTLPGCRYVQFVDGDCVVQEGWIPAAKAFLVDHPDVAAVCGRRFEAHPGASFYNQMIDKEWSTPVGEANACGGDALMRVSALTETGAFRPELLAGEEPELCTRFKAKGWRIWRLDAPMTEHDARLESLAQWLRRSRRGGAGYAQVWSATRHLPEPLYARQLMSSLFWTAGIPLIAVLLALLLSSWALLVIFPLLWCGQIVRIALKRSRTEAFGFRLRAAALLMASKFAEAEGAVRFMLGNARQETSYRTAKSPSTSG